MSPPAVDSEPDVPERPEDEDSVDLATICEDLFGPESRSFDGARIFEEKYAGRPVHWSGTLQRVDSFYRDMVFGDGPGARANLLVYEVQQGPYGGREVQAVVRLPEGADDPLRSRRGERIAFAGVLVRCDSFMRNLFVDSGRLVEEE